MQPYQQMPPQSPPMPPGQGMGDPPQAGGMPPQMSPGMGQQPPMGQQGGGQGVLGQVQDPILKKVKMQIEQNVHPEIQQDYRAIVMAGMDLMTNDQTMPDFIQGIKQASQSPPQQKAEMYGHFAAKGISIIFNQAMADKPQERQELFALAAPLAGITLLTHILQYAEAANGQPIDKQMFLESAKHANTKILNMFGIDENKVQEAVSRGQQAQQQQQMGQPGMMNQGGGVLQGGGMPPQMAR